MPEPSYKAANKAKFGRNTEDELTEWERNLVRSLWVQYDDTKKGIVKDDLVKIMERLATDECVIGKVPNVQPEDYASLFEKWDTNADGLVTWLEFREGLNRWPWRMVELERLQEIIDDFFQKSQKLKMQGKDEESKTMATQALRL